VTALVYGALILDEPLRLPALGGLALILGGGLGADADEGAGVAAVPSDAAVSGTADGPRIARRCGSGWSTGRRASLPAGPRWSLWSCWATRSSRRCSLILGGFAAFVYYKYHQSHDVRGSTTEYIPTETAPPPVTTPQVVWPMFAYDSERLHVGPDVSLRPPFRRVWRAGGARLLEFPPVIAYNRLFLADGGGRVLAFSTKTGARAWTVQRAPLPGRIARRRRHAARHDLPRLPQSAALQGEAARRR